MRGEERARGLVGSAAMSLPSAGDELGLDGAEAKKTKRIKDKKSSVEMPLRYMTLIPPSLLLASITKVALPRLTCSEVAVAVKPSLLLSFLLFCRCGEQLFPPTPFLSFSIGRTHSLCGRNKVQLMQSVAPAKNKLISKGVQRGGLRTMDQVTLCR